MVKVCSIEQWKFDCFVEANLNKNIFFEQGSPPPTFQVQKKKYWKLVTHQLKSRREIVQVGFWMVKSQGYCKIIPYWDESLYGLVQYIIHWSVEIPNLPFFPTLATSTRLSPWKISCFMLSLAMVQMSFVKICIYIYIPFLQKKTAKAPEHRPGLSSTWIIFRPWPIFRWFCC